MIYSRLDDAYPFLKFVLNANFVLGPAEMRQLKIVKSGAVEIIKKT